MANDMRAVKRRLDALDAAFRSRGDEEQPVTVVFLSGDEIRNELPPFDGQTYRYCLPDRPEEHDEWFRAILADDPNRKTMDVTGPVRFVYELPGDPDAIGAERVAYHRAMCLLAHVDPESGVPLEDRT